MCPVLIYFSDFWRQIKERVIKGSEELNYLSLAPVLIFGEITPRSFLKLSKAVGSGSGGSMYGHELNNTSLPVKPIGLIRRKNKK